MADKKPKQFRLPSHWPLADRIAFYMAVPNERGCTLWTGHTDKDGYPLITWKKKSIRVHRHAWKVKNRKRIPKGKCICHECDTPRCINADHLFPGTQAENVADRVRKGRSASVKGEDHSGSILTEDQIRAIRKDTRFQRVIAAEHGVTRSLISLIKSRDRWGHVT